MLNFRKQPAGLMRKWPRSMLNAVNILGEANQILGRFREIQVQRESLEGEQTRRNLRVDNLLDEIKTKDEELKEAEMASIVMKVLVEDLAESSVKALEKMLSVGVATIFTRKNYEIKIVLGDRGKDKTALIWLVDGDKIGKDGESLRTLLYKGNGGGLAAVASLMVRVFLIERYDKKKFIFFDESMSELSAEYIDGLVVFLDLLRDDLGYVLPFITHDTRFMAIADKVYRIRGGKATQDMKYGGLSDGE